MTFIQHKNKQWFEVRNEANNFYVLRGGIILKKDVIKKYEFKSHPIDMLISLLKKNVNICEEISGCDYEHYLDKTKNCSDDFRLTKEEFEAIKEIHNLLLKERR